MFLLRKTNVMQSKIMSSFRQLDKKTSSAAFKYYSFQANVLLKLITFEVGLAWLAYSRNNSGVYETAARFMQCKNQLDHEHMDEE